MTERVALWADSGALGAEAPVAKAEDDAHVSGDYGIPVLAVRKDTAASLAGTDGDYVPLIVDASGKLHVSATQLPAALGANGGMKVEGVAGGVAVPVSGTFWQATQPVSQAVPTTLVYGKTTVTTAGTEVALGAGATLTRGVWVKALGTNTGIIYVGLNGVSSTTGYELYSGQSVYLEIADRATVFIDASVNGEGVTYVGS